MRGCVPPPRARHCAPTPAPTQLQDHDRSSLSGGAARGRFGTSTVSTVCIHTVRDVDQRAITSHHGFVVAHFVEHTQRGEIVADHGWENWCSVHVHQHWALLLGGRYTYILGDDILYTWGRWSHTCTGPHVDNPTHLEAVVPVLALRQVCLGCQAVGRPCRKGRVAVDEDDRGGVDALAWRLAAVKGKADARHLWFLGCPAITTRQK